MFLLTPCQLSIYRCTKTVVFTADITEKDIAEFDIPLVNIKALKETDMSVEEMAVELKKKLKGLFCFSVIGNHWPSNAVQFVISYQLKLIKLRAELDSIYPFAVPFLSRAVVLLS